jgi:hypothetical protein
MLAAVRPPLAGSPADGPLGRLDRQAMTLLPTPRRPAGVAAPGRHPATLIRWLP